MCEIECNTWCNDTWYISISVNVIEIDFQLLIYYFYSRITAALVGIESVAASSIHLSDMISLNNAFDCCFVCVCLCVMVLVCVYVQYASIKFIYALIGN